MAATAHMTLEEIRRGLAWRKQLDKLFILLGLGLLVICLGILAILFLDLVRDGSSRFGWNFLTSFPSRKAENAGILSAAVGTSLIMFVTALVALPVGVAAAIYLEEYAPKNWFTGIIEINVTNLAGVPSIVYGLLALGLFVYIFGFGQSILTAGLTLALLILPIVVVATRESLRAVPKGHQGPRAAVLHGRHPHRPDPRALPRHRRDGPDHHHRRARVHRVPAAGAGHRGVPVPELRVAVEFFHGHADPDVQLGVAAGPGIPGERGGRRRDPARHDPADERDCDLHPLPLPQEDQLVSAMTTLQSVTAANPKTQAAPMQGDTSAQKTGSPSLSITLEERRTTAANPPKASAEKLNFWYGTNHALKNINLVIPENQVTALIGPSGCGKSTFLRCFNRMHDLQPDTKYDGAITLRPDNVNLVGPETDPIEVRMRIGMVFQKPNPFPKTVFENVAYGLRLRGFKNRTELAERVEKALRGAAIWEEVKDRLNDSALALSGGQMQRVCIARALATDPEILLFDEPTSALDPIATAKIEELITELRQRVTVLIVTHNMQQAARVSDFTAFMYLGELVEVDATSKIFTNPAKKATEDYITGRYG